jgi:hypothetical protein
VRRARTDVWSALLILATTVNHVRAQNAKLSDPAAIPQVVFAFERQGLSIPKYRLTIHKDGSAVYEGEELPQAVGPDPAPAGPAQPFRSVVSISSATVDRIFALSQKLNRFNIACASKAKNIADTGTKTLTYNAPDGAGSCNYNYSENRDVQALTETLQAITETMDQGRRLDYLHRYDRLGLDAAMIYLTQEVSEGRALEVPTIAPSLRAISADAMVIQRARAKADALLTLVPAAIQPQ